MDSKRVRGGMLRCGVNRFSFNAAVMNSPVVVSYGRSVYGLFGAKVDRKMFHAAAWQARRDGNAGLAGCGHTPRGQGLSGLSSLPGGDLRRSDDRAGLSAR